MIRYALAFCLLALPALAGSVEPREGWEVHDTGHSHDQLVERLEQAVKDHGMAVVTRAGPTGAAAKRGIEIPKNLVMGVFNNDVAVRVLALSVPAMIEAPIRFYLTEDEDGSATLSYKRPSFVWAPYMAEGGAELEAIAAELDGTFEAIAAGAAGGG